MSIRSETPRRSLVAITAIVLALALPYHLRPDNFTVDDGYFYPQIARFIAHGQGSTFNGITLTNGYHPLWMLFCVVAAWCTSASTALIQMLSAVQDLFLLGAVLTIATMAWYARMRGALLGCLGFLFFNMVLGIWRMLESPLALFLQCVVVVLAVDCIPPVHARLGRYRTALLGVAVGLTVLARLDLAFFAAVVVGYTLLPARGNAVFARRRVADAAVVGGLAALMVTPYLVWNSVTFHHLLPVSGAIKSTFPHVQHWAIQHFTKPVVAAILLNLTRLFRKRRSGWDNACVLTAVAAGLHLTYTLSFGELAPWYLTTGYLTVALCVTWVTESVLRRVPRLSWMYPALTGLVCLAFFTVGMLRSRTNLSFTRLIHGRVSLGAGYVEPKRVFAEQLARRFPAGMRMYVFDAPGGLAFYSGMALLPVDGLVSDYSYNREIVEQGAAGYAATHQIEYFIAPRIPAGEVYDRLAMVGHSTADGQVYALTAPLTRRAAGQVQLPDSNLVFAGREMNPELEAKFPEVGVWRLNNPSKP